MYCPQCGKQYTEAVNYCSDCGAAISPPRLPHKHLTRSKANRKIAGVCAGFAKYLDLDPTVVRLVWLLTALFIGWGFLAYLIAWIVMPDAPAPEEKAITAVPVAPHPAPNGT